MAHTRPGKRRDGPPGLPGGSICPFESSLGVAWRTAYHSFRHSTTLTRGVGRGVPFRVRPPPHQTVRAVFPHTASRVKLSLPIPLATQHRLSRQSFLSEGELHEARQASPCGDMRGFFFRIGLFRQSDLPLSIPDVSFYTRNPFAPRALPRFPATMDSSDSSFRFRSSEVSQVPGRTVATRPPTVSRLLSPPHADWTVCEGFTLGDGWPAEMYRNETLPPIHLR